MGESLGANKCPRRAQNNHIHTLVPLVKAGSGLQLMHAPDMVFFKDYNIILKYSIICNCFGLKKPCLYIGRRILNMKHTINTEMCQFW